MQTLGTQHYHLTIGDGWYEPFDILPLPGFVANVVFSDPGKAFDAWVKMVRGLNYINKDPIYEDMGEWKQHFVEACWENSYEDEPASLAFEGTHLIEVRDCWDCYGETNN